jgi:uncharacterized protein
MPSASHHQEIPHRRFGRYHDLVSIIGLGGYHLGMVETVKEAVRIVHEAIDAGLNFLDNAWEYHDGKSEARMGRALAGRRDQVFLMTKVCTHGRDAKVAMRQLEQSLRRLRTDHLDLWQIHEVVFDNEPARHFAKGGVVEALDLARKQGKVRFVGFTGHKDPRLHLEMLSYDYEWDACQLPLNCFDGSFRSFEQQVLPELNRRGIAPIGMKSMCGDARAIRARVVSPQDALSYTLSLPIATLISGIDSPKILRQNLAVARGFTPMSARERAALRQKVAKYAVDGRYELFKIGIGFEGNESRLQHGVPLPGEVAM